MAVGGEVRRDPVEDHADACPVEPIDEVHEVLGSPVASGWSEVRRRLIPPRGVVGVLGEGEKLDVGEAHFGDVRDERVGEVAVGERLADGLLAPGPGVDLVDGHRGIEAVAVAPCRHPVPVAPVVVEGPHHRRGLRRHFRGHGERVRLLDEIPGFRPDRILVRLAGGHVGNARRPEASVAAAHRCRLRVPVVEVAGHRDVGGVRRPHRKPAAATVEVGPQVVVGAIERSLAEQVDDVVWQAQLRPPGE